MIDELKAVDTGKHEIVIKWQLFNDCPPNEPLDRTLFVYAYEYAKKLGYQTTASVFDRSSLDYLLTFDIPFVKIANRPDLYWLAGEVPRKVPVIRSVRWGTARVSEKEKILCCISEYPATRSDYVANFTVEALSHGISDHTTTFDLWHDYQPDIIEWHYKLEDSTGPDAGEFARTPKQLEGIL